MAFGFYSFRRRLPHWRSPGAVYFVTWRLHRQQARLLPDERTLIAGSIEHFSGVRYDLAGYVVMDDHVHVLVAPCRGSSLESHVSGWKSFTSHSLGRDRGRSPPIWQDEYFDRIIRDERDLLEKMKYIMNNPRKRGPDLECYPWLSLVTLPRLRAAGDGRPTRNH